MLIISIKIFLYKHLHPSLHISGLMIEYTSTPGEKTSMIHTNSACIHTLWALLGMQNTSSQLKTGGGKSSGGKNLGCQKNKRVVVMPLTRHYHNRIVQAFHGIPALPGGPGGPASPPKEAYNCAACTCCNRCISSGVLRKHNRIKS